MINKNQQVMPIKQALWMLWFAILMSQAIIAGIAYVKMFNQAKPGVNNDTLVIFASIVFILIFISQHFFNKAKNIMHKKLRNPEESKMQLQKSFLPFLLCWVIGEAITLLGLVMPIAGGAELINYSYIFFAMGIGLHLYRRPR